MDHEQLSPADIEERDSIERYFRGRAQGADVPPSRTDGETHAVPWAVAQPDAGPPVVPSTGTGNAAHAGGDGLFNASQPGSGEPVSPTADEPRPRPFNLAAIGRILRLRWSR